MRQPLSISTDQLDDIAKKQEGNTQPSAKKAPVRSAFSANKSSTQKWQVPHFPDHVNVNMEKERAFHEAKAFMNRLLEEDDMSVELENNDAEEVVGKVINLQTGDVINTYKGMDLLKVYAQNYKGRGLIVDGNV